MAPLSTIEYGFGYFLQMFAIVVVHHGILQKVVPNQNCDILVVVWDVWYDPMLMTYQQYFPMKMVSIPEP